ncbi:RNA polymerase recycling motor HelD [Enterococcus massiliensis]|uniref:RNA polymerase recycling motor HelD n=1 Tax=Enterococcus massiliensis TaxID=1640685 RepID=UPI00065DF316|nr:RNA polymerase recycling motor HelD [Enterococcus massiliensis]
MEERIKEQMHADETIGLIGAEQQLLEKQQQVLTGTMQEELKEIAKKTIRSGSDEAFYESAVEYRQHEQELLLKYQTAESQQKRIKTLQTMSGNPYFARIDFKEETEKETLYLGIASLRDKSEETIVIDWRAPIANLYYEGELGPTFYETDQEHFDVELLLKRQFKIQEGKILSMVDTSEVINDEFLLEILDEASSSQMKNIVSTIQKAQNQIIRDTHSKIMLIEGIAGSGKTSALLQRVAFLLYRHRKWLDDKQVLLFSPNHLFSDYIAMVLPSLGESEVPTRTFRTFISQLVPGFEIEKEAQQEEIFLSGKEQKTERLKSGMSLVSEIQRYSRGITSYGPLFRSLKVKGEVKLSAAQIRQWYQETNQALPLYQRTQLLQTKLLKKIGGLQKDEAKKNWVKELAEEKLQEFFADNPNQDDSEENERRIRGQIRKQIARRYFRGMTRAIQQFQFINYSKQYLHFLQSIPETKLEKAGISKAEWAESQLVTREKLKNKVLTQEDAVLFFLLSKELYPAEVPQKARFIFIDEMQDFPPAQVALLRRLYPKATLTLCGDLNQKVFGNETIVGSLPELFPNEEVTRYQLTTSYRSTKEITDFANQFLTQDNRVELTARKGELPLILTSPSEKQRLHVLEQLLQDEEKAHFWRSAVICKTAEECEALYQQLSPELQKKVQLIVSEDTFMKRSIMIIPAFLAKGLEFDQVFAWNIGENFQTAQDQLILYTIATRAMHELTIFTPTPTSPLLAAVKNSFQEKMI